MARPVVGRSLPRARRAGCVLAFLFPSFIPSSFHACLLLCLNPVSYEGTSHPQLGLWARGASRGQRRWQPSPKWLVVRAG